MLSFTDKMSYLENYLTKSQCNYADIYRTDILIYLGGFEQHNDNLKLLNRLKTTEEIEYFIDKLTSRIIMKYDQENEELGDFIFDFITNG